jgi:hypothetical protein
MSKKERNQIPFFVEESEGCLWGTHHGSCMELVCETCLWDTHHGETDQKFSRPLLGFAFFCDLLTMKRLPENEETTGVGKKRPRSSCDNSPNGQLPSDITEIKKTVVYFSYPGENCSPNLETNKDSFEVTSFEFCASLSFLLQRIFRTIHGDGYHLGKLPEISEIYEFIKRLFVETEMEFSCGIVSLVYIFRAYLYHFYHQTFTPFLTEENWRSIIISSCLLASKLFDDLCMSNKEFAETFEKESLTLSLINSFELMMLRLLNFNLAVREEEYAGYANLVVLELQSVRSFVSSQTSPKEPQTEQQIASAAIPTEEPILKTATPDPPSKTPSQNWWEISLPPLSWVWAEQR